MDKLHISTFFLHLFVGVFFRFQGLLRFLLRFFVLRIM